MADVAVEDEVFTEQITEAAMLARMAGMLGGFPDWMLMEGSFAGAFFTQGGVVYERCTESGYFQVGVGVGGCMCTCPATRTALECECQQQPCVQAMKTCVCNVLCTT